jgi:5-methylcytosine-specific restriction endonuclease McrA
MVVKKDDFLPSLTQPSGSVININQEDLKTPTAEWVYNERIKLTAGLSWRILKRDNFRCCICGKGAEEGVKLEVDHKRPVKKWGKTEEENLWTMCGSCNRGKGVTYQDLPNELNLPTSG